MRCLRVQSDFHKGYTLGRMTCANGVITKIMLADGTWNKANWYTNQTFFFFFFLHTDTPLLHFFPADLKGNFYSPIFTKKTLQRIKRSLWMNIDSKNARNKSTLARIRWHMDATSMLWNGMECLKLFHIHHFMVPCSGGGSPQFLLDHIGYNDSYTKSHTRVSPIK